ncbi:MAG: glycosyltransferase [Candidatus Latescibacteria bacterium]|nr:glycosyltransferase [Candidatus Latescibacterota bacterium]
MLRNQDIVYIGNDWFADNRTSSHQIARLLSRHNRLVYVEAAGQRAPTASKRDLAKIVSKLKKAWADPVRVADNVHVYSPLIVPFHRFALARRINRIALGASIRRACRKVGFERPILWIILPHYSTIVDTVPHKGVVYYVVDEYSAMPGVDPDRIRAMEDLVLRKADVVFAISEQLAASKGRVNAHTYFSPHGVETAHFARAHTEALPPPRELEGIARPVVGFFGLIEDWIDFDLLEYLARARPHYSFVMVGRVARDIARFAKVPNVLFLGKKSYEEIPSFLRAFDVCHIPFKLNDVILHSSPLKLKEYLAGGKPVVSVAIDEVKKLDGLAYVAGDYPGYLAALDLALAEDSPDRAALRVRAMERESWESKVETISARVAAHVPGVRNE